MISAIVSPQKLYGVAHQHVLSCSNTVRLLQDTDPIALAL